MFWVVLSFSRCLHISCGNCGVFTVQTCTQWEKNAARVPKGGAELREWNSAPQTLPELARLALDGWAQNFRQNLRFLCKCSREKEEESSRSRGGAAGGSGGGAAAAAHGHVEDFLVEVGLCIHQVEEVQEAAVLLIPLPWQGTQTTGKER